MSVASEQQESHTGFDSTDHQASYIFVPGDGLDPELQRPHKRRKVSNQQIQFVEDLRSRGFPTLFGGAESQECVQIRQRLFQDAWARSEAQIQVILRDANEVTLREVTAFVDKPIPDEHKDKIPTGLIVTGPNIASQGLLFGQLADQLQSTASNIVVTLRSGDAPNLRTTLKKLIRDATDHNHEDNEDDPMGTQIYVRKLLNYDLQLLQNHVTSHNNRKVIVAFQDSEAFDSGLLKEVLTLFHAWRDRIPFVVLFGIATSVELFHERLPGAAIRCLYGAQFDVEQTSKTLEKIFQKVIVGQNASLRFGSSFVTSLLERQYEYVQSLQSFISSLKYAYMCHFYANPLSIFSTKPEAVSDVSDLLQTEHFDALRMLPSFKKRIEALLDDGDIATARSLLDSNKALWAQFSSTMYGESRDEEASSAIIGILRSLNILAMAATAANVGSANPTELYVMALSGTINDSRLVVDVLDAIKRMKPADVIQCISTILESITLGDVASDLDGWSEAASKVRAELSDIQMRIQNLDWESDSLRSKYSVQKKAIRTTVIAQKVQLSKSEATLSAEDKAYTEILDELLNILEGLFTFENPQDRAFNEVWLYDHKSPNREVFTPKPRHAIERGLCEPHDYLGCACCNSSAGGLSASQPSTAILYQLYLETGGLINVFDLWSAFSAIVGGEDGEDCEERRALAMFYRALADLKIMGMVKQSRKKTDHLGKLAWKGL